MRFFRSFEEGAALAVTVGLICVYVAFTVNARLWVTRTDAGTIQRHWAEGRLALNGAQPLFAAMHAESNHAAFHFPASVDAVVVPAGFLTPDHDNLSRTYEERLIGGYRYALMSGAPLMIVSGTGEACELAKHFLLTSAHVLPRLFPTRWLRSISENANATALALREALAPGLRSWHGVSDMDVEEAVAMAEAEAGAVPPPQPAGRTLDHVFRATPMHPTYRHFMVPGTRAALPTAALDGTLARRAHTDTATALLAALHMAPLESTADARSAEPRVASYGSEPDEATRRQLLQAWQPWSRADSLAFPHVLHHKGRDYVLPGILIVENDARDETEAEVAEIIYAWTQRIAASLAANEASTPSFGHTSPVTQAMRWLNASQHVVLVVSASTDQQYVKLLHRQALRQGAHKLQNDWRLVRRELRRLQHRESRHTASSSTASDDAPSVRFQVLVAPPLVERLENPPLEPMWLPYTGLLPDDAPTDVCGLAKWLGPYSHYIYDNYRRIADGVMSRVASAAQVDELQLLIDVLRGLDRRKLSLADVVS